MASKIDISNLTLNPEEAKDISRLIIEREFVNGALSRDHAMYTGALYKEQIPFAGAISDSLKKSAGCVPNAGGNVILTEKFWEMEIFDSRWIHCSADLNRLFKMFQKEQRINPDYFDKQGSQEMGMIYSLIAQMLRTELPKKVWFSDKAAADVAGGGSFTNGTDLDLYNVIDGLFKQLFAEIAVGASNHVDIAKNTGASYSAQALTPQEAFELISAMPDVADERLIGDPSAKILVTRSIADPYKAYLRENKLTNGFYEMNNGVGQLAFDGIPMEVRYDWDRVIKSVQNDGTKWNLPHRAVMTTPDNIPVGTVAESDFETLDSFYDRTLKSNITDVALSLDAKHLEDYRTVIAY